MCKKLVHALERIADALESRSQLDRIEGMLNQLIRMEKRDMAKSQEILDLVNQLNDNTNEQAGEVSRISQLLLQIKDQLANGVTADEAQGIVNQLQEAINAQQAVEDNLKALGADPNNPVPTPES